MFVCDMIKTHSEKIWLIERKPDRLFSISTLQFLHDLLLFFFTCLFNVYHDFLNFHKGFIMFFYAYLKI